MNQAVTLLALETLHEEPSLWLQANRRLLAKSLSELSWEEAITPYEQNNGGYTLKLHSGVHYQFNAWQTIWDQLMIDSASIIRSDLKCQRSSAHDVSQFFIDAREELGLDSATLANFLEELANTLMAEVRVQQNYHQKPAAELIELADDEGRPPQSHRQ